MSAVAQLQIVDLLLLLRGKHGIGENNAKCVPEAEVLAQYLEGVIFIMCKFAAVLLKEILLYAV
ncbi:hypothetical protein AC579_4287 [Pseudocercospora musae]|uniref:Uncharacterized protein n=1 Tax=Pseudocercospora musae TaxID=113226 RepID=A0A139IAS3_9PEZI|nr:hypothetical protein AC579_4287 [Pseudocercospora musae]